MKRNIGLYLILSSFVLTIIGSVLKIRHHQLADLLLGFGIATLFIGIGIVVFKSISKK